VDQPFFTAVSHSVRYEPLSDCVLARVDLPLYRHENMLVIGL
jgi:hypothetical protein